MTSDHDTVDSESEDAKVDDAYITSVRNKLTSLGYDLNKDGLVVQTNLDSDVQQRAYDIANTDDYVSWKGRFDASRLNCYQSKQWPSDGPNWWS